MVSTKECLAGREHSGLSLYPIHMADTLFVTKEQVAYLYVVGAWAHTCRVECSLSAPKDQVSLPPVTISILVHTVRLVMGGVQSEISGG